MLGIPPARFVLCGVSLEGTPAFRGSPHCDTHPGSSLWPLWGRQVLPNNGPLGLMLKDEHADRRTQLLVMQKQQIGSDFLSYLRVPFLHHPKVDLNLDFPPKGTPKKRSQRRSRKAAGGCGEPLVQPAGSPIMISVSWGLLQSFLKQCQGFRAIFLFETSTFDLKQFSDCRVCWCACVCVCVSFFQGTLSFLFISL